MSSEDYWSTLRTKLLNMAWMVGANEDDVQTVLLKVFSRYGLYPEKSIRSRSFWKTCLRNAKTSRYRTIACRNEYSALDLRYVPEPVSRSTVESWVDLMDMNNDPDVHKVLSLHCLPRPHTQTVRSKTLKLRKVLRKRYAVA